MCPDEGCSFPKTKVRLALEAALKLKKNSDIMKIPTTKRLSERQANITTDSEHFVTIDLDNYEKNIAVGEIVKQEPEPKPVRFHKTTLVILILSLVFVGTFILIGVLIFQLAKK